LWGQIKSIFNHSDAYCDKYFVGDESGISNHFSTGITIPWSSVWNGIRIHCCLAMLHHSTPHHFFPKIVV
jgi:hypothetical protein